MAARKSGSDFQNTGPLSYLEEVPFKLNDKFRCPAKVGLPIGFCLQDCGALLAEVQYDFSLERRSVRWGEELADARAAQERARLRAEAALAEQEAQETAAASQDSDGRAEGHTPTSRTCSSGPQPGPAGLRHNAILTPAGPQPGARAPPQPPPPPRRASTWRTSSARRTLRQAGAQDPGRQGGAEEHPAARPLPQTQRAGGSSGPGRARARGGGLGQNDRPCNIRSLTFPKLSDPGDPAPPRSLPNGGPLSSAGVKNDVGRSQDPHNGTPKEPGFVPAAGVVSPPGGGPGQCGALFSLSPSERQCVETIVGMGYSYEGVMKAMQRQGQNVEQVLDYLFVHAAV
ncbi:hypothetical protein ANANG_G00267530 [Anguilla anguilla]|uniref:UBA domain-containing protein n=1 Tax=Anguilla anguilla TaxID=7936 RepID=A0A9D3LQE4_ANGAN|nr:hypothetical protein ANANG_G00267530 [Anguilla anguilla]